MVNHVRPLTHKTQRKLTDEQVRSLLSDYVNSETTYYKALSEKFGIAQRTVGQIVRGLTYREVPGIAELRKKAQQKAGRRNATFCSAQALRVPDPSKDVIEVDRNSIKSINEAMLHLQSVLSQLTGSVGEDGVRL
jgi:hypothetical protein